MVVGGAGEGGGSEERWVGSHPRGLFLWRLWSCLMAGWAGIIKSLQLLTEWVTVGNSGGLQTQCNGSACSRVHHSQPWVCAAVPHRGGCDLLTPPTNCRPRCFKTGQTFRDKNLLFLIHMKIHIKLPFSSALALLMQCPGTFINERSYRRFAASPRQYNAYIGTATLKQPV